MTCIVGICSTEGVEGVEGVWLGGDSGVEVDDVILQYAVPKVFRIKNALFGAHGTLDVLEVLRNDLAKILDDQDDSEDDFPQRAAKAIRHIFKDKPAAGGIGSDIIFGYKRSLYQISAAANGGLLKSYFNFLATGSGRNLALGSLDGTGNINDPVVRIEKALKAAAAFDHRVREPFTILHLPAQGTSDYREYNLLEGRQERQRLNPNEMLIKLGREGFPESFKERVDQKYQPQEQLEAQNPDGFREKIAEKYQIDLT